MAWLLRKMLLGGRRSLLAQVNDDFENVTFRIHDAGELPARLGGVIPLQPIAGKPSKVLDLHAVLREPVFGVHWVEHHVPVKELVAYLASVVGAVHLSTPQKAWQAALLEFDRHSSITLSGRKYTFGTDALFEIGKVTRAALADLRQHVSARVLTPFELRSPFRNTLEESGLR